MVNKLDQLEKDAIDTAGKVYAEKLRHLDPMHAERLISKVFFEAQLNNLSRYTHLSALQEQIHLQSGLQPQPYQGSRIVAGQGAHDRINYRETSQKKKCS